MLRLSAGHSKRRSLTKWNPKEHLVRWWVSHQILGKTKIIPSNDILIYKLSCSTKVCCRVAVVSGMAMETCGLSFFESLMTHSPVFRECAYRVLHSHRRAVLVQITVPQFSAPSPFNLPSTVQAVLLGLYLRWILSDLASKGSPVFSSRHLHSHRLPGSLKTESDQQEDRVALPFPFPTGTGHVSLKELCEIFVPIRY